MSVVLLHSIFHRAACQPSPRPRPRSHCRTRRWRASRSLPASARVSVTGAAAASSPSSCCSSSGRVDCAGATATFVGSRHAAVRLRLQAASSASGSHASLFSRAAATPPGGVDSPGVASSSSVEDPPLTPGGAKSEDHPKREGSGAMREVVALPVARGLLLLVPLLWATYNPALRYIYESAAPPSPAELTAVRMLISLVPFSPVLYFIGRDAGGGYMASGGDDAPAGGGGGGAQAGGSASGLVRTRDAKHIHRLMRAGVELGLLNWAGTAAQAWGLEQTSSTRAGFLLSTINVMVPVGAALQGYRVPPATWAACALALAGVVIISEIHIPLVHLPGFGSGSTSRGMGGSVMFDMTDASGGVGDGSESAAAVAAAGSSLVDAVGGTLTDAGAGVGGAVDLSGGDAVVLLAAVLYSAFTIRLGTYAREFNAADLSAVKSLVMVRAQDESNEGLGF